MYFDYFLYTIMSFHPLLMSFKVFIKNVLHDDIVHTLLMHGDLCSNIEFSSMLCASFDMIVLVVSYFTLE